MVIMVMMAHKVKKRVKTKETEKRKKEKRSGEQDGRMSGLHHDDDCSIFSPGV